MNARSLSTLALFALTPSLWADEPLAEAVEIKPAPKIAICRVAPNPNAALKEHRDLEATEEAIQSLLQREETKTTLDKLKAPLVIESMEEALKHLSRASMERIAELVDFETQQLALFAWQGSGQDRLNGHLPSTKDAAANFHYTPGRTRDLRIHSAFYSMPKGTKIEVRKLQMRMIECGVGQLEGQFEVKPLPGIQRHE